jgi:predicted RNase H-like HicB family nuclease
MIYRIELEKADDGGVGAFLPDLPGVVAVGESREEALTLLEQAVRWHVEAMRTDGTPLPEPVEEATVPGQWSLVVDGAGVPHVAAPARQ